MKKIKKINSVVNTNILEFNNPKIVKIFSSQINCEKSLKVLVKVGDFIKKNQPILEREDGQKLLSSISGKVIDIGTTKNIFNEIVEGMEIENDNKNIMISYDKPNIKNIDDFIKMCKDFAICNKEFFLSDFFKNLQFEKELIVDASFEEYNNKNYQILVNYKEEILKTIAYIFNLFNLQKIYIFLNKNNKSFVQHLFNKNNYYFITKNKRKQINLVDLINIFNALNGKPQTNIFLEVNGEAIKRKNLIKIPLGTSIQSVIDFMGGFKQNIEEIENFKYTAMLAFNDELELKNKIKICKNSTDKNRLKKLLIEKKSEAKNNIYSKLNVYHEKFLDCLSACLINELKHKNFIYDFENYLQNDVFSLNFLSNKEFS